MDDRANKRTEVLAPDAGGIAAATRILARGGLVAFPTETVYGLGADAGNGRAVAEIYQAKSRPRFNPLIAHVESIAAARRVGRLQGAAARLAERFWPGPLTLVVPACEPCPVSDLARAGLPTVAIRVPAHAVGQALIAAAGQPLVAPSANRSGHVTATTAQHVLADLSGRIDAVIDGGPTPLGLESTILACLGGEVRMLRAGGLPREAIEAALGFPLASPEEGAAAAPVSPGQLASHYAPRARLRLGATEVLSGEGFLGFGPDPIPGQERAAARENLSPSGDLAEAAANLFAAMRRLDAAGVATIAVAPIPEHGLGEAIADRLSRAAHPER
jgi:L-threonylcarbamoyladenylate synthase